MKTINMKKILFSIVGAFMVSTMASAQYVNVRLDDGTYHSYKTSSKTEVSFGDKAGAEIEEISPTIGAAKRKDNIYVPWVRLWKGGPKFAVYNVGAESATEYGGYYTWGGTYNNNPALEGFKWTDDHNEGESNLSCTGDNITDTDTATKLWGSNWRMPTQSELQELLDNCDVQWTNDYKGDSTNIKGTIFTGKGNYKDNSVFLPAAGYCDYGDVFGQGDYGLYWSSTPYGSYDAYRLYFDSGYQLVSGNTRGLGFSVRAVLNENE